VWYAECGSWSLWLLRRGEKSYRKPSNFKCLICDEMQKIKKRRCVNRATTLPFTYRFMHSLQRPRRPNEFLTTHLLNMSLEFQRPPQQPVQALDSYVLLIFHTHLTSQTHRLGRITSTAFPITRLKPNSGSQFRTTKK
jgi:hypothetical protein